MVLFSPKGTSLKLFAIEYQLNIKMEYQNTHASNLGLNIGPDGNQKNACCWCSFLAKAKAQAGTHAAAIQQMHGSSTEKE